MRRSGFGVAGAVGAMALLAAWSAGCEKRHEHVDVIEVHPEHRVVVEHERHVHVERDRRHDDRHDRDHRDRDRDERDRHERDRDEGGKDRDDQKEHRYGND